MAGKNLEIAKPSHAQVAASLATVPAAAVEASPVDRKPPGFTGALEMGPLAADVYLKRYSMDGKEAWRDTAWRVASNVLGAVPEAVNFIPDVAELIEKRVFMPGGRYLYASGREFHQTQNCILVRPDDSREGWGLHTQNAMLALMTGAGLGGHYGLLRAEGEPLSKAGGFASGPLALMQITNEIGRGARQGGSRRGALWAGLPWDHPDIFKFIACKDWPEEIRALKRKNQNFPAFLDYTNISVCLNTEFFKAYYDDTHPRFALSHEVFWAALRMMLRSGEPGFSVDVGENENENLRNACTEITSVDSDDICNLGSINLARIETLEEMQRVVELGVIFLLAGTVYSDVPYANVAKVREKNRRLGLGLMGIHEWLIARGLPYDPNEQLEQYLKVYATSGVFAARYAKAWGLSVPVKTRAIAPTGTISIVGETTSGVEPIFAAAYKRLYRADAENWVYQIVLDPTAKRLVDAGADPDKIEDSLSLAMQAERRFRFQRWLQNFVDHGISSTLNLPAWGSDFNNEDTVESFGDLFLKYLPGLRGITVYPDGARDGQPLSRVDYRVAVAEQGEVITAATDVCDISKGESCGA